MMTDKKIILLGSTGSVGLQAADVARTKNLTVRAVCAKNNVKKIEEQIREFRPVSAAMTDPAAAKALKTAVADLPVKIYSGANGICEMISDTDADVAVNSIIGYAGLMPTFATIESKKDIALANKESLVIAGELVMSAVKKCKVDIAPVDSEHCAIDQCLRSGEHGEVKKLIITASGGPFFGRKREELSEITVEQALAHPTWSMGAKITIDSATLMNKGFEVIEAAHLFGVTEDKIQVIVHRESIIHSMVEFCDNSIIAQLSVPDMRLVVQYALSRPARYDAVIDELDFTKISRFSFAKPDEDTFLPLKLARKALRAGGAATAVLNAVNEVAVDRFLHKQCEFYDIIETLDRVCGELERYASGIHTLEGIKEADRAAREATERFMSTL